MTREDWLNESIVKLRPWFAETGFAVPDKVRASIGWPSAKGLSKKKRVIGECWSHECSTDGFIEIFVSPYLGEPYETIETLLHEMIHGTVGIKEGHKGDFIRVAKSLGFDKPWTKTPATDSLRNRLMDLLTELPGFPGSKLDMAAIEAGAKKPQSTRMIKAECGDCGYTVRLTRKWMAAGLPLCPTHRIEMVTEEKDDDDE